MLSFLTGLLIGVGWAWHDSFYTKIRRESLLEDRDMEKIYDWSLQAKAIKAGLFIIAILAFFYASWHFILAFGIFWLFGFDQAHAKFAWGKFMTWTEYLQKHILHRVWQWYQRKKK